MTENDNPLHALSPEMVREYAKDACANLCDLSQMRRRDDLRARAQVIHAAITTRQRFQALYDRGRELREALERFKARREKALHKAA